MSTEFRCPTRLHFVLTEDGLIEVKCRNNNEPCGASSLVTVLHYFDPSSGRLVRTRKFRNPSSVFKKEVRANGSR